jgi:hypothetical protein
MSEERIAAVTERLVYVFKSPLWGRMSRATGVVAKHPIGSVRIRLNGWALHIGTERMVVHLHHRGPGTPDRRAYSGHVPPRLDAARDPASGVSHVSIAGYRAQRRPPHNRHRADPFARWALRC